MLHSADAPQQRAYGNNVLRTNSYLSSSDPRVHFGIGTDSDVRRAVVRWPSGIVQEVGDAKPGRYNVVEEAAPEPGRSARPGALPY